MRVDHRQPVTHVLKAAVHGDSQAAEDLLPLVYDELRALARARLNKIPPGQTLQPTALVHEAYLRVVGGDDPGWDGRNHFFAAAARAMRDILVEQARRKQSRKRGGNRRRIAVENAEPIIEPPSDDVLAVDEAVKRLEQNDPRKGQIVNLRYFARLTAAETAAALGVSVGTIEREWRYIRTWLQRELDKSSRA
ncbi:MAG: sigma-70 family RNA polymerase sigma factor [Phycisphaerales bacterium]|nr:MAG: sigma-70 family RNA polymerase sigma factor [Phycisphaerales bacterium]